jgi:nucleoside-diphosphate-sugar epimerase
VTGATGFIGRHLVRALVARGWRVRALARRVPSDTLGASWISGALADTVALTALVQDAHTVIHAAGAIKALSVRGFMTVNADGTARLATIAAAQSRPPRFIHLSSLAAREPHLSPYAASKAAGEAVLGGVAGRLPTVVVRPPAVYGPGDPETLRIFRLAARGLLPVPATPGARLSLAHVSDAVAAILAAVTLADLPQGPIEFDDGAPGGHSWGDIAAAAATALGRNVRTLELPQIVFAALGTASGIGAQITRRPTVLTRRKVAEILHPNWVVNSQPLAGYTPAWSLAAGFRDTAEWAVSQGLVRI